MTVLRILLGAAFTCLWCLAAGALLLRALSIALEPLGRAFAQFVAGAMVVSSFVFLLCAAQALYTPVLVIAGGATIMAWLWLCRPNLSLPIRLDLPPLWQAMFWLPWVVFGFVYLIVAMSPEISPDGTGYHLGLVSRYVDHHGFYTITTNMFAGLFGGIEMLFMPAFAIGRHSAAALVHLFFLLVLPFGILAIATQMGEARAGVIAAMLFYLSPVVGKDAASAYIDVGAAAVVVGSYFFLQRRHLLLAGLLAGFAVACKITAAGFLVYLVIASRSLWPALAAGVPVSPWLIKNVIQFQNPFFPLMNRYFPNRWMYVQVEEEMRRITAHLSNVTWPQIPWEATVGGQLGGIIGPVFLLAPIALFSLRRKPGRDTMLAFTCVMLPFAGNIGARFLIPALPFLGLGIGLALTTLPVAGTGVAAALLAAHALLGWPTWLEKWSGQYQWRLDPIEWRAALRLMPEGEFLRRYWPDYERGLLLEKFVAPGEKVFSPAMGQMAYQKHEVLGTSDSALGRKAFLLYMTPVTKQLNHTLHRDLHFARVTTRAIRVVAATSFDTDLRISELRFFDGAREIPRSPKWRSNASCNPWDAPEAFDGRPVSFWGSGTYTKAGMWLEVDFGETVSLNRILIEQNEDQRWISLQPAIPTQGGWQQLPRRARYEEATTPPGPTLRGEVRNELRRLGIAWILMPDSHYGADDVRNHAAEWGALEVGRANDFSLWKLVP